MPKQKRSLRQSNRAKKKKMEGKVTGDLVFGMIIGFGAGFVVATAFWVWIGHAAEREKQKWK